VKANSILTVPILSPAWKKFAFVFFLLPVILVIGMALVRMCISPDQWAEIIYGFWAIGFVMLNLIKEKD
jgi:hypothetical protein